MNYTFPVHFDISGAYKVIYQTIYNQISLKSKGFITLMLHSAFLIYLIFIPLTIKHQF